MSRPDAQDSAGYLQTKSRRMLKTEPRLRKLTRANIFFMTPILSNGLNNQMHWRRFNGDYIRASCIL
uniref:Uncharacterized protein n=1 Tax=Siphoviridae sp. ctrCN24 TaxID=2827953 RepID=A0A8S5SKY0_9CAUD|nr:MAG TPA: hypothetical protein [Siphoviridae sp. ctrCN24]